MPTTNAVAVNMQEMPVNPGSSILSQLPVGLNGRTIQDEGINKLPNELLLMIWYYLSSSTASRGGKKGMVATKPEATFTYTFELSWVSPRWRSLAVNTPKLWSYVSLSMSTSGPLLGLQLERTKNCPLHVTVDIQPERDSFRVTFKLTKRMTLRVLGLLQQLISTSERWETLDLEFKSEVDEGMEDEPLTLGKQLQDVDLPKLKELSVVRGGKFPWVVDDTLRMLRNGAPHINELTMGTIRMDRHTHLLRGLTALTLDQVRSPVDAPAFRRLLSECPSLMKLIIVGPCISFTGDNKEDQPLYFRSLQLLDVNFCRDDKEFCSRFFSLLNAPNVNLLRLTECDAAPLNAMTAALRRNAAFTSQLKKVILRHGERRVLDWSHLDVAKAPGNISTVGLAAATFCAAFPSIKELQLSLHTLDLHAKWHGRSVPITLGNDLRTLVKVRNTEDFPLKSIHMDRGVFSQLDSKSQAWLREHGNLELVR
ncbi:hypothetical protein GLOTRDRAFT_93370 [Gloeophyllum trabeum ATCC 11539]|uniref:F-box domain-containing protein n=1 Tax=Gloeophyllum trabeum (strain ATCC 11539 / FP-39264 / Madison 617) TaxID=670483 RepID=S7Q8G2_GLOTA|nr:uncharacterized protein GLOTRDRAFT_93370 [Gloeophyllum trabeum ATCC 11539]EPQ55822.1 hypothetical protein GLOTRDRAFT_93370 [Gloeophyllum trabeum ATCC 11539]